MMTQFRRIIVSGIVGACLFMSAAATVGSVESSASDNDLSFRVRSPVKIDPESKRKLLDFIPTFSEDGIPTEMPLLTLELQGLPGTPLSDNAYDAIQYAMSDYLLDLFENRWPSTSTSDFDAGLVGITANGNSANARNPNADMNKLPALTSVKTEVVNDQPLSRRLTHGRMRRGRTLQASGNAIDLLTTLTFRDLTQQEDVETGAGVGNDNSTGVEYNQGTDGETKNVDLSIPPEEVLLGAAGDAWNNLSVFQVYLYDAIGREGNDVVAEFADLQGVSSAVVFPTSPPTVAPTVGPTDAPLPPAPDEPSDPTTTGGDNTVASINDSSNMVAPSGGIDPLYPALITGIAVFLCTIIVLGYRRRHSSDLIGNKSDPSTVNVHDTFTLDGDEEIEVEDPFSNKCKKVATRRQRSNSQDSNVDEAAGRGRGFCGRNPVCTPRALDKTYEESFEEIEGGNERYSEQSGLRNPSIAGVPREDMDLYADLSSAEKQQFLRYMHSGMSIEEASRRVLEDRQGRVIAAPSSSRRGMFMSDRPQPVNSEVMADGQTMVHIPHQLHGESANMRRYDHSLVLEEADSSVASSFDDRDYHRGSGGMGSMLNIGRANSGDYAGISPSSSSGKRRGRRGLGKPQSSKGVGRSILCNPELGL
jgi:hypothetical protein